MELEQYIKKWSEKLSIPEVDIRQEYDKVLIQEKEMHKDFSEEDNKARTLQRLAMTYKKQMRSPAVGFEGMVIAVGDSIDVVAKVRREALALYKENPQLAINNGVVDGDGNPLDCREFWRSGQANRGYGKPLPEHNWIRTIFGVAKKQNVEEKPKYFVLGVSGKLAIDDNIPMFEPVNFRAIDRTKAEDGPDQYKLNSSVFTEFAISETLQLPNVETILKTYCSDLEVSLVDLDAYHIGNEEDYNRLAIIYGDAMTLVLEPTSVGSRRLVIDDEANEFDMDSEGITCWVPERIKIDFAEQSKVIILGRTARGKKLDDTGNPLEEPGPIMLNVYGLYALPEYKIAPNIKGLVEEKSPEQGTSQDQETAGTEKDNW